MRNADAADDGEALAPMEEGGASSSASGQRRADSDDVELRPGSEVRLRNLVANASLNGTAGVIRERGCWSSEVGSRLDHWQCRKSEAGQCGGV